MNKTAKNILWGTALFLVPGSSLMVGSFLLYKGMKKYLKKRRIEQLVAKYQKFQRAA